MGRGSSGTRDVVVSVSSLESSSDPLSKALAELSLRSAFQRSCYSRRSRRYSAYCSMMATSTQSGRMTATKTNTTRKSVMAGS
jgi:hypothetical protein